MKSANSQKPKQSQSSQDKTMQSSQGSTLSLEQQIQEHLRIRQTWRAKNPLPEHLKINLK